MEHAQASSAGASDFSVGHRLRILQVVALAEFKLKYAGSALGYVWSVLRPLTLFTVLYLVFGRVFKLGAISEFYAVSLLMGIVLYTFFSDATNLGLSSLVAREALLRKMRFPRMVVPAAATVTAALTFAVNTTVIGGFVAFKGVTPRLDWLLLVPLVLELYAFTLGVTLILATIFVSLRDIGQVWELALQMMFYASPIIYPIGYLPGWARDLAFLNPFTQVLQDVRSIVLYEDVPANNITAAEAFGAVGHLLPIAIALAVLAFGVALFKRYEPWFAERA